MADTSFVCGRFVVKLIGVQPGNAALGTGSPGREEIVCPPGLSEYDMYDDERFAYDAGLWAAGVSLGYPYLVSPIQSGWGRRLKRYTLETPQSQQNELDRLAGNSSSLT